MFSGSMVAVVTPMAHDGAIDYADLANLVDFHVRAGTQYLVVAGTTGESATLTHEEHVELIERACEIAAGRIPIIAGTGSNSTAQTLALSRAVDRFPVAGFLVVTPYYNKPTQEGMVRHFSLVADAVERPVILYNVPSRTGVKLEPETVGRLSRHGNIAGLKDAAELERLPRLRDACGPDFALLSGEDGTACEFMLRGGNGVISVTANVVPAAMRRLCDAALRGDRAAAEAADAPLRDLHAALFLESNPIPVKWAVHRLGLAGPGIRLPLTPLSPVHHDAVAAAMAKAGAEPLSS
ncbi:MAG TPA: 4-hydroxy-tetrahydrodipicolinate synthase [Gammaproteobacteria bacterium]